MDCSGEWFAYKNRPECCLDNEEFISSNGIYLEHNQFRMESIMNIQLIPIIKGKGYYSFIRITPKFIGGTSKDFNPVIEINKKLLKRIQEEMNIDDDNFCIQDMKGYHIDYVLSD